MDKIHLKSLDNCKKKAGGTGVDLKGLVDSRKCRVPTLPVGQRVQGWAGKGLRTINQLYKGTELKSFFQLQEQFDLPSKDLYRYLQIRHYVTNHKEKEMVSNKPNEIEDCFINVLEKQFPTKKHLSNIYKRLVTSTSQNTEYIKEKWELEMNVIIEDSTWKDIWAGCHKGINSQLWKEFDWKVKIRFFNTPFIISSFVKTPNVALCWRKCGNIGDTTHIFWDCPVLRGFWGEIKKEIDTILEIDVALEPMLFLLGAIPKGVYNVDQRYALRILLLVAKKMITVNWREVKPPTIGQWTQRLKNVYLMERMTASLQLRMDTFMQRWSSISRYLRI